MANYYSGRDARVVHVTQGTFGTEPTLQDGVIKGTSAFDIEMDLNVREADMVTGQRWRVQADTRTDDNEAMPTLSEDGVVFKLNLADDLYAMFQANTEVGSGDFPKIFYYHATQPDFPTSAGFFETLVLQNVEVNTDVVFKDVITNEITFSVEPRGELQQSISHVSRGSGSASSEYDPAAGGGTVRNSTGSYHFTGITSRAFKFGSTFFDFNPIGAIEVACTQVVQPVGVDALGNGKFETYLLTDKNATFKAKINFDHAARVLKNAYVNDTAVDIFFGWGTKYDNGATQAGTVDGDLFFSGSAKVTSWKEDLSEAYGVDVEFAYFGLQDSDALVANGRTTSPIEVRMADGVTIA